MLFFRIADALLGPRRANGTPNGSKSSVQLPPRTFLSPGSRLRRLRRHFLSSCFGIIYCSCYTMFSDCLAVEERFSLNASQFFTQRAFVSASWGPALCWLLRQGTKQEFWSLKEKNKCPQSREMESRSLSHPCSSLFLLSCGRRKTLGPGAMLAVSVSRHSFCSHEVAALRCCLGLRRPLRPQQTGASTFQLCELLMT